MAIFSVGGSTKYFIYLIIRNIELFQTRELETREKGKRCIGHVETFQLVLDPEERVRINPLQRVTSQAQPKKVGHAAEGLIVDDGDVVVREVLEVILSTRCEISEPKKARPLYRTILNETT